MQVEIVEQGIETAALAAMGEGRAFDIKGGGVELRRHGGHLGRGHMQEPGFGVDEAADQPGAGDAVDPGAMPRDPEGGLPDQRGRHQRQARCAPCLMPAFKHFGRVPPARSKAAAPSDSFRPRAQITTARRPCRAGIRVSTSVWALLRAVDSRWGSASASAGRRTSIRAGAAAKPIRRASWAGEIAWGPGIGASVPRLAGDAALV